MNRRQASLFISATLCLLMAACSKKSPPSQLLVQVPAGFSGNFVLEMGVRAAAPLEQQRGVYVVAVPLSGRLQTSTLLRNPDVKFQNASEGAIWGFSRSTFTTGDGISVGGKIEFFVGTQEQFEADRSRRNKSLGGPPANSLPT